MNIFRRHIIQWVAGAFLLAGMGVHVVLPYSNIAKKTSFAQWLDGNVVTEGNENETFLRNHIKNLPHESESFGHFLKKVSLLVASNQNDFKLPLTSGSNESDNLSQWLFKQWSDHHDGTGNQDSILPDRPQPVSSWLSHQDRIFSSLTTFCGFINPLRGLFRVDTFFNLRQIPTPFLSGISINAP